MGHHNFLREAQENMEEIEDQGIAEEQVHKIAELQADLMKEFKEEED
jgi:hypothetical protein